MKNILFTSDAESDIQRIFVHYEREKEGLGIHFLDRLEEAVGIIARNPEMPQEVLPGLRHVRLKKFDAYALWYLAKTQILVIGCIHSRRNIPPLLKRRIKAIEP